MKSTLFVVVCVLTCLAASGGSAPARADIRSYCEAFARDLADRKLLTRTGEAGMVDMSGLATASLGRATGEADSAAKPWRRARDKALVRCLQQYEVKPAAVKPLARPAKAVPTVKKETASVDTGDGSKPGTDAWNKQCLAKHPTFSAETGMYKTWSGSFRKCR